MARIAFFACIAAWCWTSWALDLRELRPYLPRTKMETEHFIVMCDDPGLLKEACMRVERVGGRIWGEVRKNKSAPVPWSEKPIMILCARRTDFKIALDASRQGQQLLAPSATLDGKVHRCCFAYARDPLLFTDTLPSLLALHILDTVFGSRQKVPTWYLVGLHEREHGSTAESEREKFDSAVRDGEAIPLETLVSAGLNDLGKWGSTFNAESLCFVDFFIARVSGAKNQEFLEAAGKGASPKALLGVAFGQSFRSIASLEKAFFDFSAAE